MADSRPDPDLLLEQIRAEESRAARGRLRIYFGSSAGVGKTFAMLGAARKLRAEGVDVVAGVIETHGRADTAAQIGDLERLPPAQVAYRGRVLPEFDLDAALARRPALVLVDELAHSNVPGSRHPKRWQDVDELLAAGIDVYSTLNVQHLESLNDVVGGITGVRVQETLPDTFFDAAAEVVLVDTPADELIARLRAGKVYAGPQAERAGRNFFRKGNLMALRELALRRTADRVEDDVQAYRVDQSIDRVWKTEAALLCCIGPPGPEHADSNHLVRSAARLAQQLGVAWHAVYVETPSLQRLSNADRERTLRTLALAEELGATTAVLSGQDVATVLIERARQYNLSKLLMGYNRPRPWWRRDTFSQRLARLAPDVDLIEIGQGGPALPGEPRRRAAAVEGADADAVSKHLPYLWAFAACAATTLVALPLQRVFDLANIVMLFLLAVVGVAVKAGRGPAVLAAFLNVAAFDFFFVAPQMSFAVADVQYLLTFGVMLAVGLVTGQLTAGARFQAQVATSRESRSRALFDVSRRLSSVLATEQVVETAEAAIAGEFRARAHVFLLDLHDRLQAPASAGDAAGLDAGTAQWALDHDDAAGLGTDTLPGSAWLYLPLKAPMRARGVLAVQPADPRLLLVPEQRRQLETFALLAAIALERVHYVEVAQHAVVQMESERLRNSLLSALSHDLRTPLTAIYGLADLLVARDDLAAEARETAVAIGAGARRLNAMVDKLLDMARLQSGTVQLKREWQPFEEVVGSALAALGSALARHRVVTDVADDLPLVAFDAVLIERVLVNLIENASKYTPAGSTLTVAAAVRGTGLVVSVADDGPGLPPGREDAVFEKFVRGAAESATPGVGLGLAICRAIVEAHGGRISAEPGHGPTGKRGASFRFTLPLGTPPLAADAVDAESVAVA